MLTWMRYVTNIAEATKHANVQALAQVQSIVPGIQTYTGGTADNPETLLNLLDVPKVALTNVVNQILGKAAEDPILKEKTQAALDLIAQTAELQGVPTTVREVVTVLGQAGTAVTDSFIEQFAGWRALVTGGVMGQNGSGYSAGRPEWSRQALSIHPVDDLTSGAF